MSSRSLRTGAPGIDLLDGMGSPIENLIKSFSTLIQIVWKVYPLIDNVLSALNGIADPNISKNNCQDAY